MNHTKERTPIAMVEGFASGKAYYYQPPTHQQVSTKMTVDDLIKAVLLNLSIDILHARKHSPVLADILTSYKVFIEDPSLYDYINAQLDLEFTLYTAVSEFFGLLLTTLPESADVQHQESIIDVYNRFIFVLTGTEVNILPCEEPIVIFADDFNPSDFLSFPLDKVSGIVINKGSRTSHSVEIAEQLNIPFFIKADVELSPALNRKRTVIKEDKFSLEV